MSLLSAKARAFSVDELLGRKEKQTASKPETGENDSAGEEICPSMGDESNCRHKNVAEILGQLFGATT